jgi:hypothetical protein
MADTVPAHYLPIYFANLIGLEVRDFGLTRRAVGQPEALCRDSDTNIVGIESEKLHYLCDPSFCTQDMVNKDPNPTQTTSIYAI